MKPTDRIAITVKANNYILTCGWPIISEKKFIIYSIKHKDM